MNAMPIIPVKSRRWTASALALLIGIVFQNCSQPEMIGVHARGIIASWAIVQHTESFGDCSPMNEPTGAMRFNWAISEATSVEKSIPLGISIACPNPALLFFLNEAPKSLYKSLGKTLSRKDWVRVDKTLSTKAIAPERNSVSFLSHNQFIWLCHASGSLTCAEAFLFSQSGHSDAS